MVLLFTGIFANAEKHYQPDTQKEVYYEFFNELDSAVVALIGYIEEKTESNGFARFDILLDGKYSSWVKPNSLRLRLAMRLASIAPDKARLEIEKIRKMITVSLREDRKKLRFLQNRDILIRWENLIWCGMKRI